MSTNQGAKQLANHSKAPAYENQSQCHTVATPLTRARQRSKYNVSMNETKLQLRTSSPKSAGIMPDMNTAFTSASNK